MLFWVLAALAVPASAAPPPGETTNSQPAPSPASVRAALDGLRVPFVANDGRLDPRVAYYVPTPGAAFFVTRDGELVYSLRERAPDRSKASAGERRDRSEVRHRKSRRPGRGWALTETLVGGRTRPAGQEPGTASVGDFRGNDPARWRSAVPTFQAVDLGEVWPGVTVRLQARAGRVEKIFTVEPGASADPIGVRVRGAKGLSVKADGSLVARTGFGDVTFTPPVAYQERDGVREPVRVTYRLDGRRRYGFDVGAYDPARPLVIDPLLQSTFLGGSDDEAAYAMAIHPVSGDVFVTGDTYSTNFPGTTGGFLPPPFFGDLEGWVARLDRTLTVLKRVTYFGGSFDDSPFAIAIHPDTGHVYIAGVTDSPDLPATAGAFQDFPNGTTDAFVAWFDEDLLLFRATYLGGTVENEATALGINRNPANLLFEVYVAGSTESDDFPGANNSLDAVVGIDAFVARLTPDLANVMQSTYLGGTDEDRAYALGFHPVTGAVYVAGDTFSDDFPNVGLGAQSTFGGGCPCGGDAFVAKLDAELNALLVASYLGGTGDDFTTALVVHPTTGDVYVAGGTFSNNFPGAPLGTQKMIGGDQDAFVSRLNSDLSPTGFVSTYLGGTGWDEAAGLAIHPITNELYVAGGTASPDFPSTAGGVQDMLGGCGSDMFIARLSTNLGTIFQATYLGGGGCDDAFTIAIHGGTGDVYVAGATESPFPGTDHGAQSIYGGGFSDAVVARLTRPLTATEPDLTIAKTHVGNFFRGQVGATYTLTVTNIGTAPTDGSTVTVTDTVPAGLTPTAIAGAGWSCTLATLTCTRNTVSNPSASYPPITLTVDVDAGAPGGVINTATVSGGGDVTSDNNTASNPTTIVSAPDLRITKTHAGSFSQGQAGAAYTITVRNGGSAPTDGSLVTVSDAVPAGLTPTSLSGFGWACTLATRTCTRSTVWDPLESTCRHASLSIL